MPSVRDKLNDFYRWLTWSRITNFILAFLIVKLLTNAYFHEHPIILDFVSIFFYIFGLICGIALTLSVDRRIAYHLIMSERKKRKLNGE